ncbi:MAG: hypothetical protein RR190_06945 [Bacteroidales bacterium]
MIWIDARLPLEISKKLAEYGNVYRFKSEGIVYGAIAGHPDIFMCKMPDTWIVAPNIPQNMLECFEKEQQAWCFGSQFIGTSYPKTVAYNVVVSKKYAIANFKHTDAILKNALSHDSERHCIHVKQGYARCNAIFVNEKAVLCSDKSIEKALQAQGLHVLYINPSPICLEGFEHGFIGGCCGVWQQTIFFTGSLSFLSKVDEVALRHFLSVEKLDIVELGNHPLIDGGGILFS